MYRIQMEQKHEIILWSQKTPLGVPPGANPHIESVLGEPLCAGRDDRLQGMVNKTTLAQTWFQEALRYYSLQEFLRYQTKMDTKERVFTKRSRLDSSLDLIGSGCFCTVFLYSIYRASFSLPLLFIILNTDPFTIPAPWLLFEVKKNRSCKEIWASMTSAYLIYFLC